MAVDREALVAKLRKLKAMTTGDGFIDGLLGKLIDQKPNHRDTTLIDAANAELSRIRKLSKARALTPITRARRFDQARASGRSAGYEAEIKHGVAGSAPATALLGGPGHD